MRIFPLKYNPRSWIIVDNNNKLVIKNKNRKIINSLFKPQIFLAKTTKIKSSISVPRDNNNNNYVLRKKIKN